MVVYRNERPFSLVLKLVFSRNIVKTHIVHSYSVASLYVAPEIFVTYVLYSMVSIKRPVLLNFLDKIFPKKYLLNNRV